MSLLDHAQLEVLRLFSRNIVFRSKYGSRAALRVRPHQRKIGMFVEVVGIPHDPEGLHETVLSLTREEARELAQALLDTADNAEKQAKIIFGTK